MADSEQSTTDSPSPPPLPQSRETGAVEPARGAKQTMVDVPGCPDVYYNPEHDNFYRRDTHAGMGEGFHRAHIERVGGTKAGSVNRPKLSDGSQTTEAERPKVSPDERDLRRAAEMEERIIARIKEGLASIGLPHVNPAPNKLSEYIAMHLTEVREEGAVGAHQLWQSGALPAFAEGADEK